MCEIVKHTVAASSRTLYITDGTEIEILHEVRLGNVTEQRGPETVIECLELGEADGDLDVGDDEGAERV